jgi:hypothetical protein
VVLPSADRFTDDLSASGNGSASLFSICRTFVLRNEESSRSGYRQSGSDIFYANKNVSIATSMSDIMTNVFENLTTSIEQSDRRISLAIC